MFANPEITTHSPERLHTLMTQFFLWLAMVDLKVEAEPQALKSAQKYTQTAENPAMVLSLYPHTGHTDSLFIYRAVSQLLPNVLERLQFVSARDTWQNPLKRALARATAGDPFLFNRHLTDKDEIAAEIARLKSQVDASETQPGLALGIYPQGTRDANAKIGSLPVHIAHDKQVGLGIFNIYDAETVFPKAHSKQEQANQILEALIRRLRSRRQDHHTVTVRLTDFITPEEGLSRPELKRRYLASHTLVPKKT